MGPCVEGRQEPERETRGAFGQQPIGEGPCDDESDDANRDRGGEAQESALMRVGSWEKRPGHQEGKKLRIDRPCGHGPIGRADCGRVSDENWDSVETRAARVHVLPIE
jgi:hypothetical protein